MTSKFDKAYRALQDESRRMRLRMTEPERLQGAAQDLLDAALEALDRLPHSLSCTALREENVLLPREEFEGKCDCPKRLLLEAVKKAIGRNYERPFWWEEETET